MKDYSGENNQFNRVDFMLDKYNEQLDAIAHDDNSHLEVASDQSGFLIKADGARPVTVGGGHEPDVSASMQGLFKAVGRIHSEAEDLADKGGIDEKDLNEFKAKIELMEDKMEALKGNAEVTTHDVSALFNKAIEDMSLNFQDFEPDVEEQFFDAETGRPPVNEQKKEAPAKGAEAGGEVTRTRGGSKPVEKRRPRRKRTMDPNKLAKGRANRAKMKERSAQNAIDLRQLLDSARLARTGESKTPDYVDYTDVEHARDFSKARAKDAHYSDSDHGVDFANAQAKEGDYSAEQAARDAGRAQIKDYLRKLPEADQQAYRDVLSEMESTELEAFRQAVEYSREWAQAYAEQDEKAFNALDEVRPDTAEYYALCLDLSLKYQDSVTPLHEAYYDYPDYSDYSAPEKDPGEVNATPPEAPSNEALLHMCMQLAEGVVPDSDSFQKDVEQLISEGHNHVDIQAAVSALVEQYRSNAEGGNIQ